MNSHFSGDFEGKASGLLVLILIGALAVPARAQRLIRVPVGTIIPLRMETYLSSESSRLGERFVAEVNRDVSVDGLVAVPAGSKVEGHVTGVTPATRTASGTIAVAFDRIRLSGEAAIPVDGSLTTLSEEGRRQLEASDEGAIGGGDRTRRAIVFIGGGAGVGALIGALAGGGKGAAVGAGVGAVLGTIGVLLGKGDRAEVQPGTEFGMMVERQFTVPSAGFDRWRDRDGYGQGRFTSPDAIRFAQIVLRDRAYYTGPVDGQMNLATRAAIRRYQQEQNLVVNGDLDLRTARELGVANEWGFETSSIDISNARAERVGPDGIRISVDVRKRGPGWQVFVNRFVSGNTLHLYVRGTPPRVPSNQGGDQERFSDTYYNMAGVTRVVFHGPQRDIIAELSGSAGDARQIAFLADKTLRDYQRELNVRTSRGQVYFDPRRDFTQNEMDLLFQLQSLQAAAELYNRLVPSVSDVDALRGAADSLVRQMRLTRRIMRRGSAPSPNVAEDWQHLRNEVSRISLTDTDVESDRIQ